jgi:hypothetical protein
MAKQPKKSKTPRVKGGGKDRITGFYIEDPTTGVIFKSDVKETINPGDSSFVAADRPVDIEFELGRDYITWTFQGEGWGISRVAAKGNFNYDKTGRLVSATVTDTAQEWPGNLGLGGVTNRYKAGALSIYSAADINKIQTTGEDWQTIDSYMDSPHETTEGTKAVPSGSINGTPIWTIGQGKNALETFGNGKFFYDGWESSPFASNLI